jgi:hypothetical protein
VIYGLKDVGWINYLDHLQGFDIVAKFEFNENL